MENNVQNIGKLNYLLTIFTGKNRQVRKFNLRKENKELEGDYIITIGKKAVIITKNENNKQIPIIVKRWKEDKGLNAFSKFFGTSSNSKSQKFVDSDGLNWILTKTNYGSEYIVLEDANHEILLDIVLR